MGRKITLGSILAVVIIVLIFLAYLLYRFVALGWEAALFYLYLTVTIVVALLSATSNIVLLRQQLRRERSTRETIVESIAQASPQRNRIARLRGTLSAFLRTLDEALVWPSSLTTAFYYLFAYQRSLRTSDTTREYRVRDFYSWMSLHFGDIYQSSVALALILLLYMLDLTGVVESGYGRVFVILLGSSVVVRHLRYFVTEDGLIVQLRRSVANSYATFLLLLISDFCILVLTFAAIPVEKLQFALDRDSLVAAFNSLFVFKELLTRIFEGRALSLTLIATSLAGVLFYLALLRSITNFPDFRTVDKDLLWQASRYNQLGDFTTSLKILGQIESGSTAADTLEIGARLGLNDLDGAQQRARSLLHREGYSITNDLVFMSMVEGSLAAPLTDDSILSFLQYSMRQGVSDFQFMIALPQYVYSDYIMENVRAFVLPLESAYPLASAYLTMAGENTTQAIKILNEATPGTELEEVLRLILKLWASCLNEKAEEEQGVVERDGGETSALSCWLTADFPIVKDLLSGVSRLMDKALIFGPISFVTWLVKYLYEKQQVEELDSLLEELKADASVDPKCALTIRAAETRLEWLDSGKL